MVDTFQNNLLEGLSDEDYGLVAGYGDLDDPDFDLEQQATDLQEIGQLQQFDYERDLQQQVASTEYAIPPLEQYPQPERPPLQETLYRRYQEVGRDMPVHPHWDSQIEAAMTPRMRAIDDQLQQSFFESAGDLGLKVLKLPWTLAKGIVRSVNFFEGDIDTRERLTRAITLGTFFIPLGGPAMGIMRGASALQRSIAVGAFEGVVGGGLAAIRGDPILPSAMVSGALGGVLGRFLKPRAISGSGRRMRPEDIAKVRDEWLRGDDFFHPENTPLRTKGPWAILSGQKDGLDAVRNTQLDEMLERELLEQGYVAIRVAGKRSARAQDGARKYLQKTMVDEAAQLERAASESLSGTMRHLMQEGDIVTGRPVAEEAAEAVQAASKNLLQTEDAWLVIGMDSDEALKWGAKYGQDALVTSEGLFDLAIGKFRPLRPDKIKFNQQVDSFADYWSELRIGEREGAFGLSFGNMEDMPGIKRGALGAAQKLASWIRFDPLDKRILTKLRSTPPNVKLMEWYTKLIRPIARIEQLEKKLMRMTGQDLAAADLASTYFQASASSPYSLSEHILTSGLPKGLHSGVRIHRPFKDILKEVGGENIVEFNSYLTARRLLAHAKMNPARELPITTHGRMTIEELEAFVNTRPEHFKKLGDEVMDWRNKVMKSLLGDAENPVLTEEMIDRVISGSPEFVPLRRAIDQFISRMDIGTDGLKLNELSGPLKEVVKWDAAAVEPPLATMIKEVFVWSKLAYQQKASGKFIDLVEKLGPAGQKVARKIDFAPDDVTNAMVGVYRELSQASPEMARTVTENADMLTALLAPQTTGASRFASRINPQSGQVEWFEILDPMAREAFKFMAPTHVNKVIDFATIPSKMLRAGATWSLEFMGRNVFRDLPFAFITAGQAPREFFKGLFHAIKRDEIWEIFEGSGAARSAMVSLDVDVMGQQMAQFMKNQGQIHNVLDATLGRFNPVAAFQAERVAGRGIARSGVMAALHPLQALSQLTEYGSRVGAFERTYRKALAKGMTDEKALFEGAMAAKKVTVDFSMHGNVLPAMRLTTAFWNPMLQGMDTFARALKNDPAGAMTRSFMAITLPSILLYLHNRRDPEYFQLPDWERNVFWHFKAPEGFPVIGDRWLRIPKPFEPGMIFGSFPERVLEAVDKERPDVVDEFGRDYVVGTASEAIPMPTIIKPFFEMAINRNLFRDRPIVPRSQQEVEPRFRGTPGTSDTAKMLARSFPFTEGELADPLKIDHVLFSWGGGLGRSFLESALDPIARSFTNVQTGEAPEESPFDIPFVKGFVSRFPQGAQTIEDFYDAAESDRESNATYHFLRRTNRIEDLMDYVQENVRLIAAEKKSSQVLSTLSEMRRMRDAVRNDPTLTGAQKREVMEDLDEYVLELVSTVGPALEMVRSK